MSWITLMLTSMNGRNGWASARKGLATRCTVWGVPIKKTLVHPKADENARRAFLDKMGAYEKSGRIVVYIDESGFAHDMPRTRGYATRGRRCVGLHDWWVGVC